MRLSPSLAMSPGGQMPLRSWERAVNAYGRLDVLVNSAGITPRTVRAEADFEECWKQRCG